jgi:hypothetical protein
VDAARHTGLITLFQQHFVKTGLVPAETGKVLARAFKKRQNLAKCSWWVSVGLSAAAYVGLRFVLPLFIPVGPATSANFAMKGFLGGVSAAAPLVALVLLIPAPLAAIRQWREGPAPRQAGRLSHDPRASILGLLPISSVPWDRALQERILDRSAGIILPQCGPSPKELTSPRKAVSWEKLINQNLVP